MSTYTVYDLARLRDREVLLAALATMGFGPEMVQVFDRPVTLIDYEGRPRPDQASIVIRRHHTGHEASNDIGFIQQDGVWKLILSEWDEETYKTVSGYGARPRAWTNFAQTLETNYKQLVKDKAISTVLTRTIPRLKAQGKLPANATVMRTESKGTTRVVVSY